MSFRSIFRREIGGVSQRPPCMQKTAGIARTLLRCASHSSSSSSSRSTNVSNIQNTPHLKRKLGQHLLVSEKILSQIVDAAQIPTLVRDKQQSRAAADDTEHSDATEDDIHTVVRILEIGPGTGNLTSALLNASPRVHVHAVEYDTRMVERLNERFTEQQDRLKIEQKDFEEFEFASHQVEDADGDEGSRAKRSSRASRKTARLTKRSLEKRESDAAKKKTRVHFDACVANIPYQLSSIIISRLSNYMHRFPTHFKSAVLLVQEEFALRLLAK